MRLLIFGLLLLAMLALMGWLALVSLPYIASQAQGLPAFDMRSAGYSEAEARAFLTALTPEGRAAYLGQQRLLDTAFPPLLALVLTWSYLALMPRPWALGAAVLAVAGAGLDLVENARVAGLLRATDPSAEAIAAASWATASKSMLLTAALAVLVLALVVRGLAWLRRRRG